MRTVAKGIGEKPLLQISRGQMEMVQEYPEKNLLSLLLSKILFTLASRSANKFLCTSEYTSNSGSWISTKRQNIHSLWAYSKIRSL